MLKGEGSCAHLRQTNNLGTFTYNARNRLVEVKRNGITLATYQHNGKGERVSKTVHDGTTTVTTYFIYDLAGNIIAEADGTGTITREYAYHHERLAMFTYGVANEIYYYHNDHLGTPKVVTDSTGAIAWQGDYTPFGEVTETVSLIEQPFRFPGQYFDAETNLHYNYFRDYDPSIGRYIESDPIGLQGGINTYAYVEGNPMDGIDPTGEQTTYDSWCRKNPVACAEIFPPTPKPVPKPKPQESCPPAPPPPPPKDDDDGCRKATDWQLNTLGITDPHSFKADYVTGSVSKYDICVCNGGAIKIKGAGKCGKPGPSIETY